jgi:hypothetical protein
MYRQFGVNPLLPGDCLNVSDPAGGDLKKPLDIRNWYPGFRYFPGKKIRACVSGATIQEYIMDGISKDATRSSGSC